MRRGYWSRNPARPRPARPSSALVSRSRPAAAHNGALTWRQQPRPAGRGLRSIPSLSQFRRLRYLWINNNKIQDLTFLIKNYYLTELYLNNNELTDISDLFQNPLAYDPDYRLYVIYFLPSVQLLDRKLVTQRERESALHLYNPKRTWVTQSIAFGRRVDTSLETTVESNRCTQPATRPIMPSGHEFGNNTNKVPFEDPKDAVLVRATTRSLMEFSSVDWNKVPTCQERRLKNKAEEPLEKLTVQFR
ncbi:leucine-rich repeat-containing protein 72 isoform X4 [Catharus ustulatus]|uniref:leucine-rich repeat-containing protein 72 isoform X4 n=1 Tax=Catharus ustulatus TaxID=91951 RepID=UPI001409E188|nr:leucine-rich repeat-containing protein 72 isoform X4 [Catharus ustulatus]